MKKRERWKGKGKNSLSIVMNCAVPMKGSVKPSSITAVYQPEFSTVMLTNVRLN